MFDDVFEAICLLVFSPTPRKIMRIPISEFLQSPKKNTNLQVIEIRIPHAAGRSKARRVIKSNPS